MFLKIQSLPRKIKYWQRHGDKKSSGSDQENRRGFERFGKGVDRVGFNKKMMVVDDEATITTHLEKRLTIMEYEIREEKEHGIHR
jgi:hypothetical protein